MVYIAGSIIFILVSVFVMNKSNVINPFSKGILLGIVLSLLANLSLAENVANNLQPEKNDGYSIRNGIARWILGDDGGALADFKSAFATSINFTLLFLVLFVVVVVIETRTNKKKGDLILKLLGALIQERKRGFVQFFLRKPSTIAAKAIHWRCYL